jgi:hypothetical protein
VRWKGGREEERERAERLICRGYLTVRSPTVRDRDFVRPEISSPSSQ